MKPMRVSIDNIINLYQLIVYTALESKDSKVEHTGAQLYLDVGGKGFEVTLLSLPQHRKPRILRGR